MGRTPRIFIFIALLVALGSSNALAQRDAFGEQVRQRVDALFHFDPGDEQDASIQRRYQDCLGLANEVAAHAGKSQMGSIARCEGALGTLELLLMSNASKPKEAAALFGQHPEFMIELGLLSNEQDHARGVIDLATRLMSQRGPAVDRFPALAAAVCVVHDMQDNKAFERRINENSPRSSDPLEIFDYFVTNASSMTINPSMLPALALVYVVDVTETPQELLWAMRRYRSNPSIKDRFFEIEYDTLHFRQGKPKRVTDAPGAYNLEKIHQYGGVCADQAYYAMSVAKACGIPSAYVVARGADVSHAWVGFVETRGRNAWWNFDAGRYSDYQKLRGNLLDPQTLEWISDGRAGVLGGAIGSSNDQVRVSMAAAKIVHRMSDGGWTAPGDSDLPTRGNIRKARTDSVEDRLTLLRSVLSDCAGVPSAWDEVITIAETGTMDQKQMDLWGRAVMQLAGRRYQDFAYDFLLQLIVTVDEPQDQHDMLERAFNQFRARPDLAAGIRFEQGYLWQVNNNKEYAWLAYQDVVSKFINDGPMVITALGSMQLMLEDSGKEDQIIPILEDASRRVERPESMSSQFASQTNYYRIQTMLAKAFDDAGRREDARRIRATLGN